MSLRKVMSGITGMAVVLSFGVASAASALTVSCAGTPSFSNITWTASTAAGVAPFAFLWGNGSTSSVQTVAVTPGTYSMALQATDASSTVATTTCSATVAQAAPTITSFIATPASITSGQSSVLSWVVGNASSTNIDNGVGVVTNTSTTVTPSVTTTYHLSAVNPSGTTTASATVTVSATSGGTGIAAQIQALLNQINALKAQILLLIQQQTGGSGTATTTPQFPPGCFVFNRDLRHGDDGDDVRELQRTLASDPSIFPPGFITGFFGPRTEQALKKFQRKFDIRSTGFFGPLSRGFLKENCGKADTDHDGLLNAEDTDDDNDGILDVNDDHPFKRDTSNATSTSSSNGERRGEGRGNSRDD